MACKFLGKRYGISDVSIQYALEKVNFSNCFAIRNFTVLSCSSFIFVQWKVYVYLPNLKQYIAVILIQQYTGFFSVNRWFLFLLQIAGIFPANVLSLEINWYIDGNFAVSVLIWNFWQIFQGFWLTWYGGLVGIVWVTRIRRLMVRILMTTK